MPRRQRDDLEPIIFLEDNQKAQAAASESAGEDFNCVLYRKNGPYHDDIKIERSLLQTLSEIDDDGKRVDRNVFLAMLEYIPLARDAAPLDDSVTSPSGHFARRLAKVGCRAEVTQEQIAQVIGKNREHVGKMIKLMEERGIILNRGKGWYEFDCYYVWRGRQELRDAYLPIQQRITTRDVG